MTPATTRAYPERPDAVYFFGTCLVDNFYSQAGLAAVELIEGEGVRVIYPQDQTCCGQPPYNSGYQQEARRIARSQMALFSKAIPIVVPSGSCAAMFRNHYPELFQAPDVSGEEQSLAASFAGRVYEWSEFMHHVLKVNWRDRGAPVRVSYHPSCHLLREMGVRDAPLALLAQLAHVTLQPVQDSEECCGFGGSFSVKQEAISAAMVADKCQNIVAGGAQVLVSGDCGCLMNIGGALAKGGHATRVLPLAQFLKERVHDS